VSNIWFPRRTDRLIMKLESCRLLQGQEVQALQLSTIIRKKIRQKASNTEIQYYAHFILNFQHTSRPAILNLRMISLSKQNPSNGRHRSVAEKERFPKPSTLLSPYQVQRISKSLCVVCRASCHASAQTLSPPGVP